MTTKDRIETGRVFGTASSAHRTSYGAMSTAASSFRWRSRCMWTAPSSPERETLFIPADETYRWTLNWRQGEARSRSALARGDYVEFSGDDPAAIERFLIGNR